MLEPQTRASLTDLLRPPSGFELAYGVGTTFTLDLTTALMIPLSLGSAPASVDDPLSILDAVRRVADRLDIFAQAGEISMGTPADLVAFLERSIHPVTTQGGLFHPKVWFLEFARDDEQCYRFVCASRNLTADRSWDAVISLDGVLRDPSTELSASNAPLVALLNHLPELAVRPLPQARVDRLQGLAQRVASVEWELPEHTHRVVFHALGVPGSAHPDLSGIRSLVISPFVSDDGLALVRGGVRDETLLISRPAEMDRLSPASLDSQLETFVLDEAAQPDDADDLAAPDAPIAADALVGLHAKVVVVDRAYRSHVFLGSANATGAAWRRNVEVMVELEAKTTQLGVRATMDAVGALLQPYETAGGEVRDSNETEANDLDRYLRTVAARPFTVEVMSPDTPYALRVWADAAPPAPAGTTLTWSLLTRPGARYGGLPGPARDVSATVEGLELADITPFLVIRAETGSGIRRSTLVIAELIGDPAHRREAVIARHLTDRESFLRLLTLMLTLGGLLLPASEAGSGTSTSLWNAGAGAGLFESLVRVVGDTSSNIGEVHRIVEFVRAHGDADAVLPPGFDVLWGRVWSAHRHLAEGRSRDDACREEVHDD